MGLTYVHAKLRKSEGRRPTRYVRLLIDSGAIYSVLPQEDWRALRLKPGREVEFTLADGTLSRAAHPSADKFAARLLRLRSFPAKQATAPCLVL